MVGNDGLNVSAIEKGARTALCTARAPRRRF